MKDTEPIGLSFNKPIISMNNTPICSNFRSYYDNKNPPHNPTVANKKNIHKSLMNDIFNEKKPTPNFLSDYRSIGLGKQKNEKLDSSFDYFMTGKIIFKDLFIL